MPATCSTDGCDSAAHGRGLCNVHYMRAKRAGSLPDWQPRETRWSWSPPGQVVLITDYRLRLESARARVTQALLVMEHPETRFDRDAASLLRDALAELDLGRD